MFLSFDTSKPPYCSFFNVCHCIVIHCLATKHSCTASSHSTGTPSYIFIITAYSHTAQTFCSTIIHCSHTAQSHCAQPCIFIIRAYSHTQLGHSGVIQHHYTVQSYSSHTVLSYIIIRAYSHTLLSHSAVIQHHYTQHSHTVQSYIIIIKAYSHTLLGHSAVIQHPYTVQFAVIQHPYTVQFAVMQHHYTVQSYSTFRQPGSHTAHTYTYHSHNEKSYNPSIMQSYGTESHHAAHSPVTQSHAACHTKKSKGGSKCVTAS